MKYLISKLSNKGGREKNEDFCDYIKIKTKTYLLLADGLGGHSGGEIASQTAVQAAVEALKKGEDIMDAMELANQAVIDKQDEDMRLKSMRTTFVIAAVDGDRIEFAHVGDSRLYVFKNDKVEHTTPDHSVTYILYKTGQIKQSQIRKNPDRNKVLRVMGDEDSFKPELSDRSLRLQAGDAVLLCTDGFWEYVLEKEMIKLLKKADTPETWLKAMEKKLLIKAEIGHDNYSAVALIASPSTDYK